MSEIAEDLTTKLQALSPQQLHAIDALVSSMLSAEDGDEDQRLVRAAAILSQPSLAQVWDNSEDDVYNDL